MWFEPSRSTTASTDRGKLHYADFLMYTQVLRHFLTYYTDPNIDSMAPIFWATVEYRSIFQKKLGSSPESDAGFFESYNGFLVNFQHIKLTQIFIL